MAEVVLASSWVFLGGLVGSFGSCCLLLVFAPSTLGSTFGLLLVSAPSAPAAFSSWF